ncbi:hypothetical protein TRFO_29666 [Tritrichomonas foetus]|uniref:Uncharacterized protein n=1 Tax=Tritrichomonas foetus TaxID=1144522 RepID=A0A1J4JV58_9EUKA|nr:hypothetical protein TRFO_29666 [Tritrichomonas foetus]|eukprot:OHT03047.1 hypothetical protein TRFO_29666 [Tritrichomonas foetus]
MNEILLTNSTGYNELEFDFRNIHQFFFFTTYSPLFLFCQTVWICINLRRFAPRLTWWQSYLLCGFMALSGKYLALFMTYSPSPLLEHPLDIIILSFAWMLVNCSSSDFFYRIMSWNFIFPFFLVLLQIVFCLIQVRSVCFGCDTGSSKYPSSFTGQFFVAIIYSSMDSFVWMLFLQKSRDFSNRSILRNAAISIIYLYFKQYPMFFELFEVTEKSLKVYLLIIGLTIVIIDDAVFGVLAPKGIDITGLTYISRAVTYYGI